MISKIQDFLFNNDKIKKIIDAPLKIKLPMTLVIFLLFAAIFYFLLVDPIFSVTSQAQQRFKSLEDRIPGLVKKQKNLVVLKKQIKMLQQYNDEQGLNIPKIQSVPVLLSDINDAIDGSGMYVLDLFPAGVKMDKNLGLYVIAFKANLTGSFSELIKMLTAMIDMKDTIVINDIDISRELDGKLIVNLSLNSYSHQGVEGYY